VQVVVAVDIIAMNVVALPVQRTLCAEGVIDDVVKYVAVEQSGVAAIVVVVVVVEAVAAIVVVVVVEAVAAGRRIVVAGSADIGTVVVVVVVVVVDNSEKGSQLTDRLVDTVDGIRERYWQAHQSFVDVDDTEEIVH